MHPFFNREEDRIRSGWRLVGQFFLALFTGLFVTSLISLFFTSTGSLVFGISMAAGALFSTWTAAKGLDKRDWSDYGIYANKNWLKESCLGFILAGLAVTLIFLIEYTSGWLTVTGFGWQLSQNEPYLGAFISYFIFMILIGFYEELIFRGYQIVNLSEGLNISVNTRKQAAIGAVILTSLLFGLLHWRNPNANFLSTLNIAVAGLMLAFPFLVTGRLSYSIGLHVGWNFFQGGIFGFAVSGVVNHASLLQIKQTGPEFVTGGAFGPEAGLLGLTGIIFITAALIRIFKRKKQTIAISRCFGVYDPES